MPTYDARAGKLNLVMRAGDAFSALVDFSVSLAGATMTSSILSAVSGTQVGTFTTTLPDAAAGQVNVALTSAQTAALPLGTYRWQMTSGVKTYLDGFVEVTR